MGDSGITVEENPRRPTYIVRDPSGSCEISLKEGEAMKAGLKKAAVQRRDERLKRLNAEYTPPKYVDRTQEAIAEQKKREEEEKNK